MKPGTDLALLLAWMNVLVTEGLYDTDYVTQHGYGFDYFYWCSSDDGFNFLCQYHTGSTNNTWRLVNLDSRSSPIMSDLLDEPFAYFGFIFESDFIIVDRGTFVDAMRVRAWGP